MKYFLILFLFVSANSFSQSKNLQLLNDSKDFTYNEIRLNAIQDHPDKKSSGLAMLFSFLLPGMGELYAGDYSTGKYYTAAEGVLWGTYIGINTYGNWVKDNYKSYAITNANISPDGKDDDYYARISEFLNIEDYNNEKLLNREFSEMYDVNTSYWKWESAGDRKNYRNMWVKGEQSFNSLRFVAGALIVNRVLSIINAIRTVNRHNKALEQEVSFNITSNVLYNPQNKPDGIQFNLITLF